MSGGGELKKTVARKEREVDYKITHYASFADNLEQVGGVCVAFARLRFPLTLTAAKMSAQETDDDMFSSGDHMRDEIQRLLDEVSALLAGLWRVWLVGDVALTTAHAAAG